MTSLELWTEKELLECRQWEVRETLVYLMPSYTPNQSVADSLGVMRAGEKIEDGEVVKGEDGVLWLSVPHKAKGFLWSLQDTAYMLINGTSVGTPRDFLTPIKKPAVQTSDDNPICNKYAGVQSESFEMDGALETVELDPKLGPKIWCNERGEKYAPQAGDERALQYYGSRKGSKPWAKMTATEQKVFIEIVAKKNRSLKDRLDLVDERWGIPAGAKWRPFPT
mmetsp:Transcript_120998/g.258404  ORF Transcript_120998/g.258404 Transcript_120998/m.258404 type:complete len:223 (+) Transcript_120998:78-746(+)